LQLAPKNPQVLSVQQRLEIDQKLAALANQVEQQPNNGQAKQQLERTLAEIAETPIASPVTIMNVARAQAALGDHVQAQTNVEKALKIEPSLAPAIQLKSKIESARPAIP
jgi:hypothetical protein